MASVQMGNFEYVTRLKRRSTLRYTTAHDREALLAPGYFDAARQVLAPFDLIDAVCEGEGRIATSLLEVTYAGSEGVRVRPLDPWRESVLEDAVAVPYPPRPGAGAGPRKAARPAKAEG